VGERHRAWALSRPWSVAARSALLLVLGSCLPTPVFECTSAEQCSDLGEAARCEPVGFCSEPDGACASGHRFHEYAGGGLAGQCTDLACGDGVVQEGEDCDDGNDIDGDGCNRDCRVSGQEVWKVEYASPGNVRDRCYSVAVDSQGNPAVIGHVTVEGEGQNLWVRKYDVDGQPAWTWMLDGEAHADEEGWSIVADDDDGFLVAGYVATVERETDIWIGKIGADGILVWDATWDGGEAYLDQARDVTFAPDGDIVAIGYATVDRNRETDLWFQRRSADGQTSRWTQHRPGLEDNAQDRAHGIAAVAGGYVGVGMKQTATTSYFWVAAFDENGVDRWADEEPVGGRPSVWTAVAAAPDGEVILAGWIASAAGDTDMWLQRRGPGGEIRWDEVVASPGGDDDKANVLVVDDAGGFIVGGEMGAGAGSTDAWIRRYGPDLTELWTTSYSGPAGDRDTTWGLALDDDGNLFACGYQSSPGTEWDLWVRKLTP
jgi:cysteine-rich repeat protein